MYRIFFTRNAEKDIDRLSAKERKRVFAVIETLKSNPFTGKKLRGDMEGKWSFRLWPYRIVYTIERKIVLVTVLNVRHRQGVYKR